jgi:hypothetical protein
LVQLTHLSHFALNFISKFLRDVPPAGFVELVKDTISKCPRSMRVFILWISFSALSYESYRDGAAFQLAADVDWRIVIGIFTTTQVGPLPDLDCVTITRSLAEIVDDWAGVVRREDFWTTAEHAIEERKKLKSSESVEARRQSGSPEVTEHRERPDISIRDNAQPESVKERTVIYDSINH